MDGFFTTDFRRFGCPHTGATERELLICPYSASMLGIKPSPPTEAFRDCSNNHGGGGGDRYSSSGGVSGGVRGGVRGESESESESENESVASKYANIKYDVISPDLLEASEWPFGLLDVIQMSFGAPGSKSQPMRPITDEELIETYDKLFEAGAQAVRNWYQKQTEKAHWLDK